MRYIFLLVLVCLPYATCAESTIDCHCFQNRSFNPQQVTAADSYYLATAQNGLMALVYGLDKQVLVKAKMAGADNLQLWIVYDLAEQSGQPVSRIQQLYGATQSWQSVVTQLQLDPERIGAQYWSASKNPEQLATLIVDRQLVEHLQVNKEFLRTAHSLGMNSQEMILTALLRGQPQQIFQQIKQGEKSWGELLFMAGINDGNSLAIRLKSFF